MATIASSSERAPRPLPPVLVRSESASSSTTIQAGNANGSSGEASSSACTSATSAAPSKVHDVPYSPSKPTAASSTPIDDPLRSASSSGRISPGASKSNLVLKSVHHDPLADRNEQQPQTYPQSPTSTSRSSHSVERFVSPFGTPRIAERRRWADRYANLDEYGEADTTADENVRMSSTVLSDEESEEKRIQQNLESWATREKQKRKEQRAARTSGVGASIPTASKLSKRLSMLGVAATSEKTMPALHQRHSAGAKSDLYAKADRQSVSSLDSNVSSGRTKVDDPTSRKSSIGTANFESFHQKDFNEDLNPTERADGSARDKGKGREVTSPSETKNPFQDPDGTLTTSNRTFGQARVKPRPGMPIVTPGRAPTIRHRAIERAEASGLYSQAPSIVATDMEAEQRPNFDRAVSNPFRTPGDESGRFKFSDNEQDITQGFSRSTTIVEGARATADEKAQNRKSTSSRFNEVGLDEEVDDANGWSEPGGPTNGMQTYGYGHNWRTGNEKHTTRNELGSHEVQQGSRRDSPDGRRQPWWTEWICGIGAPRDDEEQSGRTFPE